MGQDLGLMAGPPTPTPQAGTQKSKRMYPASINSYTEPAPSYESTLNNTGFQQYPGVPAPSAAGGMQLPPYPSQGSQFFVPGEKQAPAFGQPPPAYQQGLQPHAGQPLQPNVNQLAGQMGGMNLNNNSYGGAQGIVVRHCSWDPL
jgi:protein transport protein SEC24